MLDLTRTRPWFGMGGYGRNFVYDRVTGQSLTVVDGAVIACLSSHGIVGFFGVFGPLLASVLRAARRTRRIRDRSSRILAGALSLAAAVILFDLVINSTLPPLFIMLVGAVAGVVPGIIAEERRAREAAAVAAATDDGEAAAADASGPPEGALTQA